ncbi:MAG: 3-phytase [Haliscomenobacter sp.]|nr:3-phytase [Haliscomenobacter sp.]
MRTCLLSLFLLYVLAITSCQKKKEPLTLASLHAEIETEPVREAVDQDAADDPAIWVHPYDSSRSLVYGTVKGFGIEAYDLTGKRKFSYPIGNPNNIDVAYGFAFPDGRVMDLVGCSERDKNEIRLFAIDPVSGALTAMESRPITSGVDEIYGFCFYRSKRTGLLSAFANGKNGVIEQWLLQPESTGKIRAERIRTLKVASQPEGLVADEHYGILYVGEEDKGIWRFDAEPNGPSSGTLLSNSGQDNPFIAYDIEGLCIYPLTDTTGFLLASSQGNHSYAVFDRESPNRYIGSFQIGDGPRTDGAGETDGIEVNPKNLGEPFAEGILIVQDGENTDPSGKPAPQNFKYIPWSRVVKAVRTFESPQ